MDPNLVSRLFENKHNSIIDYNTWVCREFRNCESSTLSPKSATLALVPWALQAVITVDTVGCTTRVISKQNLNNFKMFLILLASVRNRSPYFIFQWFVLLWKNNWLDLLIVLISFSFFSVVTNFYVISNFHLIFSLFLFFPSLSSSFSLLPYFSSSFFNIFPCVPGISMFCWRCRRPISSSAIFFSILVAILSPSRSAFPLSYIVSSTVHG